MNTDTMLGDTTAPATIPTSDERLMAVLSHALVLITWILGPLIIYLLKKDESPYVAAHAKESLNFQLTMTVLYLISAVLVIILIGFLFLWVLNIVNVILIAVASVRASENKIYRYPFNLRLIK